MEPRAPTIQAVEIKTQEAVSFPDGEIASKAERSTRHSQLRSWLARIHFAFCCNRGPRHVSSDCGVICPLTD